MRLAAWSVHLLTATGAVCGLLAIDAIAGRSFRQALLWMALALLIDGIDGPLARRVRADRLLPEIDGRLLDNLVDYLTYVVVPAWLLVRADLLPNGSEWWSAGTICVCSAYQFCRADAKAADGSFRGFPSYWNVVAVYLLFLHPARWLALSLVFLLCALVFVPLPYLHPWRTRGCRSLTLVATGAWAVCLAILLARFPDVRPGWVYASLLYVPYYTGMSLYLSFRRSA